MKKLWSNNLFKLPIFLLIVGVICTIALSLVNSLTVNKIKDNEIAAVANACKASFNNHDDYESFVITTTDLDSDSSLYSLGVKQRGSVETSSGVLVGYVYIGEVQGFADKICFVASYEGGKFHKLKVTYEQESNKKGINYIKNNYVDYDLSQTNFFETSEYATGVSGASMTGKKGLIAALNACSSDYLSLMDKGVN